jgi:lysophospholipase L1-like esterase
VVTDAAARRADSAPDVVARSRDASADVSVDAPPPTSPLTVFIAGDSTVMTYPDTTSTTDQAGWGQMLHEDFRTTATIDNRAIGGRTARRFIEEGHLDEILADIRAGDYLLDLPIMHNRCVSSPPHRALRFPISTPKPSLI